MQFFAKLVFLFLLRKQFNFARANFLPCIHFIIGFLCTPLIVVEIIPRTGTPLLETLVFCGVKVVQD